MEEDKEKPKILIVEDKRNLGKTFSDILKAKGYSPFAVLTGKEGAAAVKEDDFSLALIDLKLSDIPGIEVLKEIKKSSPRTEVIILTAYASLDTAMEAVNLGAFSYLEKPYNMERLLLDIRRALERQWAEEELKSAEERYRVTFEHTGTAMAILDEDTTISLVNKEFEKLSGYSKREIEGKKSWTEFVHPEDLERMKNHHEERRKGSGKAPTSYEFKAVDREGNIRNVYLSIEMIPGTKKSVISLTDITALKRLMNELKESRKFLETIIENIPDALYLKDSQYHLSLVNQAYCDMTGLTKEEIIGKVRLRETNEKIFKNGKLVEIPEQFFADKRGGSHYTHLKKVPLTDESGKITHVLTISRDITERKRAEEALLASEKKYRELVDTSVDGVISIDSQMKIILWNPGAERIFGYTEKDMLGQSVIKITPERYRKAQEKGFAEFRKNGSGPVIGKTLEFEGLRKDGTEFPLELSVSSRRIGEKHIATAIIRDITERKHAEEALHESHEKLKELDKLKTNFLNVAYHEMRSPLGPILASASLLEQGYLTAKQKRLVFIIEQSVKQLEKLINRLLEVTRIDAGQVELRLKAVSIPEIVKNVLGYLKPLADAKKQSITIDVPEGIEIEGDEQKITAIFDNLVSNAIKYTGKNGKIDIKVADRGGEDILVSIADTGTGISEEQLSRVFERFFMADTSLSRKGGLGLGLSIVQEYVKLHGGKVWATSELGKGSNFFFIVPKKQRKKQKRYRVI